MSTNKFLGLVNGVRTWFTAITTTTGVSDDINLLDPANNNNSVRFFGGFIYSLNIPENFISDMFTAWQRLQKSVSSFRP
jgi:hypothetical protein